MLENIIGGFLKAYQREQYKETDTSARFAAVWRRVGAGLERSIAVAAVLFLWEITPRLGLVDPFLLPPFSEVVTSLIQLFSSGEIFKHVAASFKRSFSGFFAAMAIALPLGIFVGWYNKLEEVVDPLLQACRNTSVLALYPVFLLLFGLGELSKISIVIWGSVWPALLNTIAGVKNTDRNLIKAARSMGVSSLALLYKVVLPGALPYILTGVRLSAASAILVLVAAEMIGANAGLGFAIFYFEERYAVPQMYAGIILLSMAGVLVNYSLVEFEKRLTGNWKEKVSN